MSLIYKTIKERYATIFYKYTEETKCFFCGCKEPVSHIGFLNGDSSNVLLTNMIGLCQDHAVEILNQFLKYPIATVGKTFHFSAAHNIDEHHISTERSVHGHDFKLEVKIKCLVNENFECVGDLDFSKFVEEIVLEKLDHKYLNDVLSVKLPTIEKLVFVIWEMMEKAGLKGLNSLKLWETHDYFAEINYADVLLSDYYLSSAYLKGFADVN